VKSEEVLITNIHVSVIEHPWIEAKQCKLMPSSKVFLLKTIVA